MFSSKEQKSLSENQLREIRLLWNREYPKAIRLESDQDFIDYLGNLKDCHHYLRLNESGNIAAWACTFKREELPWFAMIIGRQHQKQGLGKSLLNQMKHDCDLLNAWAVDQDIYPREDGSIYPSPLDFYFKNDFHIAKGKLGDGPLSLVHLIWP